MTRFIKLSLLALGISASIFQTACERETPSERAGEQIEEAGEKVEDAAD
jgi:predicted small secreted protein